MTSPLDTYQHNLLKNGEQLKKLHKKRSALEWLRLITLLTALFSAWWIWSKGDYIFFTATASLFILFLFIVSKDVENNDAIKNLELLLQINKTEIEILDHHFTHLPDGSEFKPQDHAYANDLDVFGRASLFQYINRCNSEQGKKLIADWLLAPAPFEIIEARQTAIKELKEKTPWRQQFQAFCKANPVSFAMQKNVEDWLAQPLSFTNKSSWKILRFLLPLCSITLLFLFVADIINSTQFYPLIGLMFIISIGVSRLVTSAWIHLDKIAPKLDTLSSSVGWIENEYFKSELMADLQQCYKHTTMPASQSIRLLKKILDRLDIRLNPLIYFPLNTFLFWDIQQAFNLEKWKKKNSHQLENWFQSLANTEALSSLATLSFNHPDWAFPVITKEKGVFITENSGHPLIEEKKCIRNSFSTKGVNQLNLITGSNMAGKSTFLRSVGVNIIFAMMGSAVCASSLTLSHMKIISSMRVSDNLEESTSTFYAELKKLKEIIEAVYQNQECFLLLDEILRGTNSADRHKGSGALIKQLIKNNAAGLIATHDLELAKLADEFPGKIHNYHFDVQVANEELYFDYKLKRGICQSMNASILMKKIGIEL